jgi:hypothetical protein
MQAHAAAAARELLRRHSLSASGFDPRGLAFGPQRAMLADQAQWRCVCTTRRAGKSTGAILDALWTAASMPKTTAVYLNTTRDRAKRTVWEEVKAVAKDHGLPALANEAELSLRFPNRSVIYVSGGESKKHLDRWKGVQPRVSWVWLDECQDWDEDVLDYAMARVILPALADIGGRLTVAGTPGPIPDGVFFKITQSREWSQHAWSLFENPHLKDPRGELAKVLALRQVEESDPTIQREYFGRWVLDTAALVFGALDDVANGYDVLPDAQDWRHVAGVDFGFVDSSACEVVSWSRSADARLWVTHDEAWHGVGPADTVERLAGILGPLAGALSGAVGDPGGGGRGMMDDLAGRHGLVLETAEKREKVTGCRLLADCLRRRELMIPTSARDLRRDLRRVEWHPDHRGQQLKGHTPDRVDALLYAVRCAYPLWRHVPPSVPPPHDEAFRQRILARQAAAEAE